MQLVQSSIGMEFVNALLQPLCGTMRRRLKPLPREYKARRATIIQNMQYLQDDDVLSESEVEKQQQIVEQEKLASSQPPMREHAKSNVSMKSESEYDENAPFLKTKQIPDTPTVDEDENHEIKNNNDIEDDKDDDKDDNKENIKEEKISSNNNNRAFIFLVAKSESQLFEQWHNVLKNIVLNLQRLELEEDRNNYTNILENVSIPLLDAIRDLKSASNITIEDVESSIKCLKFLRESHKTVLNVFRKSKDALIIIWSAALLTVTTFFTATNFLIITDEYVDENENIGNNDEKIRKKKKEKKLRKERSQILRILPQFDDILYELDEKTILFEQLIKICKSTVFLTNNQWILLDSVLEYSTQISSVQFCIIEERINAIIASVLHQFNNGASDANVGYTFPINYSGYFFTQNNKIEKMKDYYIERAKVFMGQLNGYYIRGKYKEMKISKTHKVIFGKNEDFKWTVMNNSEKILFWRSLANKAKLKSITISSNEFSDNGCLYLSLVLDSMMTLLLNPSDELLYYRLSKLLWSLHEQYLWDYIDYNSKLSSLIDTTLLTEDTINLLNACLQKLLRHFQNITNWKQIKNSIPIDKNVFLRHQKSLYNLQRLYLSNCNISSIGCQYLANALINNHSLQELILDNNIIGDSGAKAIGKLLSQNVILIEIDLSHNRIDKNGFCAIVVGWQVNKKYSALKNLDLSHNKTKLRTLVKERSIPVDVVVSIQELKESVKVASF